jgi:hypothetical protein
MGNCNASHLCTQGHTHHQKKQHFHLNSQFIPIWYQPPKNATSQLHQLNYLENPCKGGWVHDEIGWQKWRNHTHEMGMNSIFSPGIAWKRKLKLSTKQKYQKYKHEIFLGVNTEFEVVYGGMRATNFTSCRGGAGRCMYACVGPTHPPLIGVTEDGA